MVLATKSKNTNSFVKFLCVLLSVACMAGAFLCAMNVTEAIEYGRDYNDLTGTQRTLTLADCYPLSYKLLWDINYLQEQDMLSDDEAIVKAIESQKDEMINQGVVRFNAQQEEAMQAYENYDADDFDEDVENKEAIFDGKFYFSYTFNNSYIGYVFDVDLYGDTDNAITYRDTEDSARQKLAAMVEDYIKTAKYRDHVDAQSVEEYDSHIVPMDLYYYYKNTKTGNVISNLNGEDTQDVMNHTYALSIVNNQPTYSSAFQDVLARYQDAHTGELNTGWENAEVYLYIDTNSHQTGEIFAENSYREVIANFERVKQYNLKTQIIVGVVLLLASIILMVYYLTVCGKRLENGKVKRAWVDYIPSDLHFVLSGGAIAGLVGLIGYIVDVGIDEPAAAMTLLRILFVGLAGLIWAIFIELLASIVRVCKSEKNFFANLFVVMLVKWVVVKPLVAIGRGLKSLFAFKPENYKKSLRRFVVAYLLVNLFFLLLSLFLLAIDADIFFAVSPVMIFLAVVFNIVCLVFAVNYMKQLDAIITAAHNRTVPQVDYNKLPGSLKTLVNSLQYTRQELDAAVSKAVRDERMRTELITNVSHDLKTPLTSIISYVDLLKGCEIENEEAQEYIGVLDEKSNRLKRLIEDLIEASKITSGVITLNPVELSLSELAAQAVYERHQEFEDNGLELVFKGDHGNINAYCDGNKTFRVLENLISNAKKYSAKNTRVYCDVYESQNFSIFEIKNISAQPLDITPQELTERFVRGDKSRTKEGNGLGLSIADNLCKAQHGHLYLSIDGDLFKAQVMLPKTKEAVR